MDKAGYKFTDLVNIDQVEHLMDLFYKATGFALAILDVDGTIYVARGWQDACTKFHRVNPETCARCHESDAYINSRLSEGDYIEYKCRNGLWDMAAPIIIDGKHLANFYFGQIFFQKDKPDMDFFRRQGEQFGFNIEEYLAAIRRIPVLSSEKARFVMEYYVGLVEFLANLGLARSKQLEAEQAVRELEQIVNRSPAVALLRRAVEGLPVEFVTDNISQFGYSGEDLISGKITYQSIIHPDDLKRVLSEMEVFIGKPGLKSFTQQYRIITASGDVRCINDHTWIRKNNKGDITHYEGIILDITDRIKAEMDRLELEKQVLHTQKLESLGVLAGGIAHDFNNLLVAIQGNAELALLDLPRTNPARDNIENIKVAAVRASELANQMLAYSGKGRFVVEPVNLNSLIRDITHLLEVAVSKKIVLQLNLKENIPSVDVDIAQIRQVLMNLITNASEAIAEDSGVITLSTSIIEMNKIYLSENFPGEQLYEGIYVCLEVSDTGCGMDEETKKKLFEPFFTTKFTGRGLGMAAVLGIVRGHNGVIKVDSEQGKGSRFKILLPSTEKPADDTAQKDSGEIADWQGDGTILVIDDEKAVCDVAKRILERKGFSVLTAGDGQEGVRVFTENADEIAAVLLDMSMPNMSGEEVFLKLLNVRKDVRVILTSGYNEQDVTSRFAGKRLAGFIQKPFNINELLAIFRSALKTQ